MNTPIRLPRLFALIVLAAALTAAACSSGAAATTSPAGPSASPSAPGSADPGGGGSAGEPGSGDLPSTVDPGPVDPGAGNGLVIPHPGQLNPHPVAAMSIEPNVDGRHVTVKLTWYSGVEPCYVLDSVKVDQAGGEIILTIIEGSSDLNTACIEIAMLKATIVDLGELAPGQYTISSPGGEAQPVIITVV